MGGVVVLIAALLRSPPDPWGIGLGAVLMALFRFMPGRPKACATPDAADKGPDAA